jgi:hypothetical protein
MQLAEKSIHAESAKLHITGSATAQQTIPSSFSERIIKIAVGTGQELGNQYLLCYR